LGDIEIDHKLIPPLRAFIVTVQWFDPRPTLHGLATQVARIIPVRLACSK
jgi:hypothetical protein